MNAQRTLGDWPFGCEIYTWPYIFILYFTSFLLGNLRGVLKRKPTPKLGEQQNKRSANFQQKTGFLSIRFVCGIIRIAQG